MAGTDPKAKRRAQAQTERLPLRPPGAPPRKTPAPPQGKLAGAAGGGEATARDDQDDSTILIAASHERRLHDVRTQLLELDRTIEDALGAFRRAVVEYAAGWLRETAKKVAVSQNDVTLQLGRDGIVKTKQRIDDLVKTLPNEAAKEFTLERFGSGTFAASSGQVSVLVERRFDEAIRRLLAPIGAVMEAAGYQKTGPLLVDVGEASLAGAASLGAAKPRPGARPPVAPLELTPPLAAQVAKVAEAVTDAKVCDAKVGALELEFEKDKAADLWDRA